MLRYFNTTSTLIRGMTAESQIRTTASFSVVAARKHVLYHHDTYHLGPLDQPVAAHIPVAAVFVFPAAKAGTNLAASDTLRHATSLVLDYYPFLAGRLRVDPHDNSRSIGDLDAGAVYDEATCSRRLCDYEPAHPDRLTLAHLPADGNALLHAFDPSDIDTQPILSIQHTRFACGGVSLGIRILHKVVDAIGYFMFARHLLEIYARLSDGREAVVGTPPSLSAYDPARVLSPSDTRDNPHPAFFLNAGSVPATGANIVSPAPPKTTGRFLSSGVTALDSLKRQTMADHTPISTFVALTSFLYQSVHRARLRLRQHDPSVGSLSPTHYLTSVNIRSLLRLDEYPHNGIITPNIAVQQDALASGSLHTIASAIAGMIKASLDEQAVERTARWISAQRDKAKLRSTFEYGTGAFMTSAWNRIDMYGPDYIVDGVSPMLVSTPFTPISLVDGLAYFLPLPQGYDGLEICLALDDRLWILLDADEEWKRVFGAHGQH